MHNSLPAVSPQKTSISMARQGICFEIRVGLVKRIYDKSHDWIHDFLFMWRNKVNIYDDGMFPQETHN